MKKVSSTFLPIVNSKRQSVNFIPEILTNEIILQILNRIVPVFTEELNCVR